MCIWDQKCDFTLRFKARKGRFGKTTKKKRERLIFIGKMCKRARRTPGTAEREASVAQTSASVAPRAPA